VDINYLVWEGVSLVRLAQDRTSGGILWTWWYSIGFHKCRGRL